MSGKVFAKGQQVTLFQNWDRKGTCRVAHLTVHACGPQRMVLVEDGGAQFEGRNFLPRVEQRYHDGIGGGDPAPCDEVRPRASDAETAAHALEMGARFAEAERRLVARCLEKYGTGDAGYVQSMENMLAKVHEPRVVYYERSSR